MSSTVFFALPAYNEQDALPPLISEIARVMETWHLDWHFVAVDDGSTDRTAAVVEEHGRHLPVECVAHPRNLGLSKAIGTALRVAAERTRPEDFVVTMDADNTHPPGLVPTMLLEFERGHDIVIASRYRPGSKVLGVPPLRLATSWGSAALFKTLLPVPGVRDYTCGYRAYRAGLLQEMFERYGDGFVDRPGFSCMADILLKCARHGALVSEVPMVLRYDLKGGASKMNVSGTVAETLQLMAREWSYRWSP